MPTKSIVKITPSKGTKVQISLAFEFDANDPRAIQIYTGIGLCLKTALTPAEASRFLRQLEQENAKLKAKP